MNLPRLARLKPWLIAAAFMLAAFLVYRALRPYEADEIWAALRAIGPLQIALGLGFTAGSFVVLSASDALAVRYTGKRLAYRRIALASFTSVSIGHVLGFAALSSGALRYRFYSRWGFSHGDVGRIVLFCGTTAGLGMITLGCIASLAAPALLADVFRVSDAAVRAVGFALAGAIVVYLGVAVSPYQRIRLHRFVLPVPSLPLALGQIAVGTTDMLMVAAVLHQMVAASADTHFITIAVAYVTANVAGVAAHVPGGLGVIEAVVIALVPGAHVIGALVAFRAVYHLLPFAAGTAVLLAAELAARRARRRHRRR